MSIKILPKEIIKQIAAGEVIDRPSAVVKELIENSIDALSSQINIFIEKGGVKLIKIQDNGIGMSKNDLLLCLTKYATSKIKNLNDLESFKSFGFRGEALTSIKNISRIKIISKTVYQKIAWEIYTEGMDSNIIYVKPSPNSVGTTIEVLDLFYNIPVRRKFIPNNKIEFIYIKNIIKSFILMKLNIGIKFVYNNKIIYNFSNVKNNISYINRIDKICGKDFINQSLKINSNYDKMSLFGWITIPENKYYSNNIKKYFYINNRIIHNKFINHIVKEICKIKFGLYYHQSFLIYLEIEPNQIDINIHPQKKDVNFFQLELIYNFFYKSILNSSFYYEKHCLNKNKKNNNFIKENKLIITKNLKNIGDDYNNNFFNQIKKKKLVILKNIPLFHFKNFGILRTIIKNTWIIVEKNDILFYLSVKEIEFFLLEIKYKFYLENKNNIEIIFLNLPIKLIPKELDIFKKLKKILKTLGFNFIIDKFDKYQLKLISIPSLLLNFNLQLFFINLFKYCLIKSNITFTKILKWIFLYVINITKLWDYFKIIDLLMEFELFISNNNTIIIKKLFYPITFNHI
ncbi:DNA mismatch repair endonuclease MutL [Enterobacteriaceae endosymbiont of Plateumaris braccata]|uniref:DNA mismatch repair endonuclease MutL n=1 Tax=Enterobacteriaceae endosymbiont of Plateumaris braccata TaxID=2675793 RepID=UPI001449268C|nr:DNA mismatch repair endonuclease MutL [Enterobacteriaceae endosymbiont of Plateumaris braccata]QJC28138.1 DNA mismatch repair endonuclease MutL [Enterobacteriaceae endosymbiont of Plateumaris braccata]